MHKHLGLVIFTGIVGALIFVPGLADRLFALFFIGLVPFTRYTIPAPAMLAAYAFLLAIGVFAIAHQISTAANVAKRDSESRERARKKVLRQTAKTHSGPNKAQPKKHYLPAAESR